MFQFGLRSMLVAMAAAAILLTTVFTIPNEYGANLLSLAGVIVAPLGIIGIVYARGHDRAFCIGVTSWWGVWHLMNTTLLDLSHLRISPWTWGDYYLEMLDPETSIQYAKMSGLVHLFLLLATGLAAVVTRRVYSAQDSDSPSAPMPYWTIPLCVLLLVIAAMIGWLVANLPPIPPSPGSPF